MCSLCEFLPGFSSFPRPSCSTVSLSAPPFHPPPPPSLLPRLLQDSSQPSPLALLAATCSKIGGQVGAEGAQAQVGAQQIQVQAGQIQLQAGQLQGQIVVDTTGGQALVPQQLELVPAQFTGNGWQIITTAPTMAKENTNQPVAVTVATTLANDSSPGGRKVREVGEAAGLSECLFVVCQCLSPLTITLLLSCWAGEANRWVQQCRSQSATAAVPDHPGSESAQCRGRGPVSGHPSPADCRWTADPYQLSSDSFHRGSAGAGPAHPDPESKSDPGYPPASQPTDHPDDYSQSDGPAADPPRAVVPAAAADSAGLPDSCYDHCTNKPRWHDSGFACDK